MNRERVDATGLSCPLPVVKTREALERGAKCLEVLVDNPTSRDNVARFAASRGAKVEIREKGEVFQLLIDMPEGPGESPAAAGEPVPATTTGTVVVISDDIMGKGDRELGSLLIKAFLNTLSEGDDLPGKIVLYNRGVLLAVKGAETVDSLKRLQERGVQILACGTCLNYFQKLDDLSVGTVSNMFEIIETLMSASRVIAV
ncbi:MAG: sulfurtransferase-like selenium metabolism protein YedF [Candidatus Geothermincolales bacterium]